MLSERLCNFASGQLEILLLAVSRAHPSDGVADYCLNNRHFSDSEVRSGHKFSP
jgi:hypothetical protein